jgi:hypothetical protein
MIANPNDDQTNGGPECLAFEVVERCEGGGLRLRRFEVRGPLRFGALPMPPELWARARPLAESVADPAADAAKEGA